MGPEGPYPIGNAEPMWGEEEITCCCICGEAIFFSKWLSSIGVPDNIAIEDACRIEHAISAESFEAIKKALGEELAESEGTGQK